MPEKKTTRHQILSMGTAGLVSRGLSVVVPIALVRFLDMDAFGQYRMLWLIGGTALLVASLGVPKSLLYFLPRANESEKSDYVNQTILLLVGTSLLSALFIGPWNPLLPENLRVLSTEAYTVPLFVFLWVLSSIIEVLPNADQRISWQVRSIIVLGLVRTTVLIAVAWLTRDLEAVYVAMILIALFKTGLLFVYTHRYHGIRLSGLSLARVKRQVNYAVPTGIAASMYQFRRLGEQWVVAIMFTPAAFGVFSVAATVMPLVQLLRKPVQSIILPKMNKAHGGRDITTVTRLNRQGNMAVSLVLLPSIGFLFVVANPFMVVLFGQNYVEAGTIFRIYLVGVIPQSMEVATILFAFAQTRFVMNLSLVLTAMSIGVSILGALAYGPAGAALGSVLAGLLGLTIQMRRVMQVTGMRLNELQDWSRIGAIVLAVIFSSIATLFYTSMIDEGLTGMVIMLLGAAAVYMACYIGMLKLMGFGWVLQALLGRGAWDVR